MFVSHDRRLIEEVATRIFHIHEERIEGFDGTYEAYKQKEEKPAVTNREEELLLIDMQLSEVLSRLSIEPSQELEETFQALLKQKSLWSRKRKPLFTLQVSACRQTLAFFVSPACRCSRMYNSLRSGTRPF